ncbi:hypothetical protein BH09GEM1_BH09GEM1_12450 [soil metagenome]
MTTRSLDELVYDSEASYRLVDRALGELGSSAVGGAWVGQGEDARGTAHEEPNGFAKPRQSSRDSRSAANAR